MINLDNNLGNKEVLAQNLRMLMEQHGYSSKDIAECVGVKPSTVSYWINAIYYPRIDKIEMLANLFHVNKSRIVEPYTSSLVLKKDVDSHLPLSDEEESLLLAYRKASKRDKEVVFSVLKFYGMMQPSQEDTTVSSAS